MLLLLGGLALWAWHLLPDDEALAAEISTRFEKASGIGLKVGSAHWALRPVPVVVLSDLATAQERPITVRRVVVRPQLSPLWGRRIAVDIVEVEGAVLPRASVRAFRGRWKWGDAETALAGAWSLAEIPLDRLRLRDVTWIDRRDIALAYDADLRFDRGWRPREAEVSRRGASPAARMRIEREGEQDRWRVLTDVGGGTWNGEATLQALDQGRMRLTARLSPKDVDIAGLVGAFQRRNAVDGKINGQTEIETEGDDAVEMVRRLHTRTRFAVKPATLKGFDLAKAVSSGGADRSGRTVFDELTGTLDTQSGEDGIRLRYIGLQARSGLLTASGSATVFNRRLNGDVAIDLVDGVVGMPLKLAGTLDEPQLSLTGGALAGAAVGTAVLPGVGTAIGARIGQQVEKIFGGEDAEKKQAPPPKPR